MRDEEGSCLRTARAAWGDPPPWIIALAMECDAGEQKRVAVRLGYSPAAINQVLKNTYAGKTDRLEAAVREVIGVAEITCPAEGVISKTQCAQWSAAPPDLSNHIAARRSRACVNCPERGFAK
jgi:DNA-binding transcriptional regulator YdaS (Cro superfamily)